MPGQACALSPPNVLCRQVTICQFVRRDACESVQHADFETYGDKADTGGGQETNGCPTDAEQVSLIGNVRTTPLGFDSELLTVMEIKFCSSTWKQRRKENDFMR